MKRRVTSILLAGTILLSTSCASIVSKSNYPLSIESTPSQANIIIKNKKGLEIYKGTTPTTVDLEAGSGFFSKASYTIEFKKDGYDDKTVPVEFKLDGWYFGNILFGGVIGLLIVDPATGAMYKLDTEFINETLTQSTASINTKELKIYDINTIPTQWKSHLVTLDE